MVLTLPVMGSWYRLSRGVACRYGFYFVSILFSQMLEKARSVKIKNVEWFHLAAIWQ